MPLHSGDSVKQVEILQELRKTLVAVRRAMVLSTQDEPADTPRDLVAELVKVQEQIDTIDRVIGDEK
jgi:hypothetical protein